MQWEPLRETGYHSLSSWKKRLVLREKEQNDGESAYFAALQNGEVVAQCSLTNIVRGPFQACHMGFSVSESFQGTGTMKKVCIYVINYSFLELGLNRIMANYMPRNERSGCLLRSLGFEKEGLGKKYLKINGVWEDHVLTSLINPCNT